MNMNKINVAIVGLGNCASSLIQGIYYYNAQKADQPHGLMNWDIGGYRPFDIEIVAAFDIDQRKVGVDINQAIFSKPNCTKVFFEDLPNANSVVSMGKILDGYSEHMTAYEANETFLLSDQPEASIHDIVRILRETNTHVLMNYLPVGSEKATHFYASSALEAGVAFVNNIPIFIASDPVWANRFEEKGLPIIGDDIKAQLGATITHRTLVDLLKKRGVKLERTYQLNTGGNTDFLNMRNLNRLASKKTSKTEAVQAAAAKRLANNNIHVGPSDYVPWQKDNKIAFIRIEGKLFGDVPMHMDIRLSVEDSPNSAGVAIDAIRCAKLALDRGRGGVIKVPSAFFCKHPPVQIPDDIAYNLLKDFINNDIKNRMDNDSLLLKN